MRSAIARRQLRAFAEEIVVHQQAPGHRDRGRWVEGGYTSRRAQAVCQPPSESVLARVAPEATRVTGAFTFYVLPSMSTIAPLRTGDMATGRDIITYRSVNYRVSSTEEWGDDYLFVYAVRMDVQEPIPEGIPVAITSGDDAVLSDGQQAIS